MPERILAEKALREIETIIRVLAAYQEQLPSNIRRSLERLYETMRAEYAEQQWGGALVRFLEALDTIPQVRDYIGGLIDATKGRPSGDDEPLDPSLLERLPEHLVPPPITRSKPPMPSGPPSVPPPSIPRQPPSVPPQSFPSPAPVVPPGNGSSVGGGATREIETSPENAGATQPQAAPALTRYPDLDYPAEVVLGMRTSLTVCLLREPPAPGTQAIEISDVTPGKLPELEVVLRTRGFDILDSNTQMLAVDRDDDSDLRFVLIPRVAGPQTIRVDFYQNNRRIGTARRETMIVAEASATPAPLSQPPRESLELPQADVAPPDLELCVETSPGDERTLYFTLHSSSEAVDCHHAPMGSIELKGTPLEKIQAVYAELSAFAGATPSDAETAAYQQRRLASLGRQLWDELFPNDLKAAYWKFRDSVTTLLITSDEPWIPWEIVKPYRFDEQNNRLDEPHLCEQFNVARWLSGPGMAETMPIRRIRPVAPLDVDLPSVRAELHYLEQINQLRPELLPDVPYNDRSRVIDLFENGAFNVLHVAAHGSFDARLPANSAISLTGGLLRPSDIAARFGGQRPRPLVFINACHGARSEYSFTGLGGWADRLVRNARIGAFIGASWEVNDQLALRFAESFYTALLRDNKTIGESFRLARQTIRDAAPANSTWLAYVLYADPEARAVV
jgi:hypothetical protein